MEMIDLHGHATHRSLLVWSARPDPSAFTARGAAEPVAGAKPVSIGRGASEGGSGSVVFHTNALITDAETQH
eukprot:1358137-Prymnesium_polylepis.1